MHFFNQIKFKLDYKIVIVRFSDCNFKVFRVNDFNCFIGIIAGRIIKIIIAEQELIANKEFVFGGLKLILIII